jgi:dTDP-4-dehydrorhamnose reductase
MSKRVFITGSGGFVGKNLYKLAKENLFDVYGVGLSNEQCVDEVVDITDEIKLREVLDKIKPSFIVHTAAMSNVEKCETERNVAYVNNVLSTKNLVEWANDNDATMIFLSSDYVFDGIKGNFTEEDSANPIQYYGVTKLEGERLVFQLKKHIILRPTVIYGWDPDGMNFFMQLYRNQKEKKEMKIPIDQMSNPTYINDLCELIVKILKSPGIYGTFIATGPESMSRYELGLKLCNYMGWDKKFILPVETKNFGQHAKRPINNSTSSKKICKQFLFKFTNLKNIKWNEMVK